MAWPFNFLGSIFGGSLPRLDAPTAGVIDSKLTLSNPIGSVLRACMDRIISRACYVEFKSSTDLPNMPTGEAGGRAFYAKVIEQMIVEGAALCYPAMPGSMNGPYKVAITAGSTYLVERNEWSLKTGYVNDTKFVTVPADRVLMLTFRPLHGDVLYLPESPLYEIADAMILYEQARKQWTSYAHRGSRIGYVLQGNKEVQNQDSRKNAVDEVRDYLAQNKNSYGIIALPMEAQMAQISHPPAPVKEAMELAVQEIARFFGVPLQLLQTQAAPQGAEELAESKLLADAVFPVCERISQGWEEHLNKKCEYMPMKLSRPTLGARAAYMKSLAGSGCLLIDEVRELADYNPLPDGKGQLMPSPQGGSTQGLAEEERKGGHSQDNKA